MIRSLSAENSNRNLLMIREKVTVEAPNGLHARPVTELVQLVKSFSGTEITLSAGDRTVRANSMLSILSLGLKQGTVVEVAADGPAEAEAVEAIVSLIRSVKD